MPDIRHYLNFVEKNLNTTTIDSPAFQRWFNGSKVVDGSGEPLKVYHGTMVVTGCPHALHCVGASRCAANQAATGSIPTSG